MTEGRERERWAVSFGPWAVFGGCILAATIFTVLTWIGLAMLPPEVVAETGQNTGRLAMLIGGIAVVFFLVVGPTFGFLLGWLLRRVRDHSIHVVVFAMAGAVIGVVAGLPLGVASLLGPMVGGSAGLARMMMSRFAKP